MSVFSNLLKSGAGALIPGSWGVGLGILGGVLGSQGAERKTSEAEARERALADLMGNQYRQYMPGMTNLLWQTAQNPESDPWFRSQMLSAEGDATRYYQGAGRDMMMDFAQAGGGRLGQSSGANDLLLSLGAQRGKTLASARVGQLGEMWKRRLAALGLLGNFVQPGGQMALSSYGGQAETAAKQESEYGAGLGDLFNLLAMQRYQSPQPPGTTGAGKKTEPPVSIEGLFPPELQTLQVRQRWGG